MRKRKRRIYEVLTTGQVSKICGASARTVTKWIDTGMLRGYRIPGSQDRRVYKRDLIAFMVANGIPLHGLNDFRCTVLFFGNYERSIQRDITKLFPDTGDYVVEFADHPFEAGIKAESMLARFVVVDISYDRNICVSFSKVLKAMIPFSCPIAIAPEDMPNPFILYEYGYPAVFRSPCNYESVVEWIRERWEKKA